MRRCVGRGLGGLRAQEFWSWGVSPGRYVDVFSTWKLSEPPTFGFFLMEASSRRHDWSLTPFQPLPSQENGGGAGISRF